MNEVKGEDAVQNIDGDDDVLLSQQVAHTQRVLPGCIWSQSVRAAGHMVLPLRKPWRVTFTIQSISLK